MRGVPGDLEHFLVIVVSDERLVRIEFLQGRDGLDRIGVDDPIPDEVLALLGRQRLDQLVDRLELGQAGHVEAGADIIKGLDDGRVAIGLDREINLDTG